MKFSFLIATFSFCAISVIGQSNYFNVGYNKNFPLDVKNNNIVWTSYKKVYTNNLWISIRGDFHTWEHTNLGSMKEYTDSIFAVLPDNNFILKDQVETDNANAGIIQLPTKDGLDIDIYANLMVGYRFSVKKWFVDLGAGAGMTYSKRQGFLAGLIATPTDNKLPNTTGGIPLGAYKRGFEPNISGNLKIGYFLTNNFAIGFDVMFNNKANTLITQGVLFSLKF